jgi:hypothetical protein
MTENEKTVEDFVPMTDRLYSPLLLKAVDLYLPTEWRYLFSDDHGMLISEEEYGTLNEESFHTFCHWALVTLGTDTPVDMSSPLLLNRRTKHDATRFGVPACHVLRFTFIPDETKLHRCDSRRIDCQHYLRWCHSQGIAA